MNSISLPNGISLELVERDGFFLGIGAVHAGDVALRNPRRPMGVDIRTPNGEQMRDFRLESQRTLDGGGHRLEFSMSVERGGLMEWMVHEVRPRLNLSDWTRGPEPAPDTSLVLEIRPVSRTLGGRDFVGFSYQYVYEGAYPIYKILDRATWEVGGSAVGSEFWMRNCFVPSIQRFRDASDAYSSEWYIPDCANPSAFQFLPLQTELQGFTFATSPSGTLVTWAVGPAHIRSLFEKPRGEELLVHYHEHCDDLGAHFQTTPMEVLFCPDELAPHERFNAYDAVRELVHDALHKELGMRRERVTTYGQIEEWTAPDIDYYRREGVPKLLAAGCKTVYIANHFQNNMNTWGVGNMCCTVDYQVADSVGKDKLRALCADVRAGGANPEMWGNTSISVLSWVFDWSRTPSSDPSGERIRFLPREGSVMEALDGADAPFVRNASNAIEADHYTPIFCVLNLRDAAVRDYWLRRWGAASKDVGLGGIFLDSSFNLSSDKFHWVQNARPNSSSGVTADQTHLLGNVRPEVEPPSAILSQYRAHLDLMRDMQGIGYVYCNEDLGVFGIHRHGPGVELRLDCLPLWSDCIATFDVPALEMTGAEADDVFFRGLACRQMWSLFWDIQRNELSWSYGDLRGDVDRPKPQHLALFHAYNEVNDAMQTRHILPDDAGIVWHSSGRTVLWSLRDGTFPTAPGARVRDVLGRTEAVSDGHAAVARHHVYIVEA